MATTVKKLTYADYEKFPDDGNRHQVVEGEEFMTPPPSTDHQTIVANVYSLLRGHVLPRKVGRVYFSPVAVVFGPSDVFEPDVLFVAEGRAGIIKKKNIQGAPDLVVEVTSPSTERMDKGKKLDRYRAEGVREYWIVEPEARQVSVHEFGRRLSVYVEGQSFPSSVVPGLTVRVDDVFLGVG